jgi:hypothetical protein
MSHVLTSAIINASSVDLSWYAHQPCQYQHSRLNSFMISMLPCALQIDSFLEEQLNHSTPNIAEFDVLVVSIGPWELFRQPFCQGNSTLERPARVWPNFFAPLEQFATRMVGVQVICLRTSGYHGETGCSSGFSSRRHSLTIEAMNQQAMDQIDKFGPSSHLSYIDWCAAVPARSLGPNRIKGDTPFHYGVEPYHVLVQMLMNHLVQRGVLLW